jgi:hypothetical protein
MRMSNDLLTRTEEWSFGHKYLHHSRSRRNDALLTQREVDLVKRAKEPGCKCRCEARSMEPNAAPQAATTQLWRWMPTLSAIHGQGANYSLPESRIHSADREWLGWTDDLYKGWRDAQDVLLN